MPHRYGQRARIFPQRRHPPICAAEARRLSLELVVGIIGWTGAGLILLSYILLSLGHLDAQSRSYQWMNVVGALCFIVNSGWNGAWPSAALNIIWTGIGLFALWRIAKRRAG